MMVYDDLKYINKRNTKYINKYIMGYDIMGYDIMGYDIMGYDTQYISYINNFFFNNIVVTK